MSVVLADYGAGNLQSVCSALARSGAEATVTRDPALVREAELAIVAGVGNLPSAVRSLEESGLAEALRERIVRSRPLLGICVGTQLLFEESEEGGRGLGILAGQVRRLRARRVPHMGWNQLLTRGPSDVLRGLDGDDVYFAHSFACRPTDPSLVVAESDHDGRIVAAVERGPLAGLQFHPERSGATGARVLANALAWSRSG